MICILSILFLTSGGSAAPGATPLGTAFTYQGRLDRTGSPYTGSCDFLFSLFDAETEGIEIGETNVVNDLVVSNGLFTTTLDFGTGAFNGEARWLELSVLCTSDLDYTTFPRQKLTATPYALYATSAPWSGLVGIPEGFTDGVDDDTKISGTCAVGSTIRVINTDGSFICQMDEVAPGLHQITTLYTTGDDETARDTSIAIGVDGMGLISFLAGIRGVDLMVAHCNDVLCGTATISPIERIGDGGHSSITIGSDGLGLISYYYKSTNQELKVAHCNDIACTTATISTLDTIGSSSNFSSITIGSDGLGLISYYNSSTRDLKVAHCGDINCSTATITTLDSTNYVGDYTSITIGSDGLGLISYHYITNNNLKTAHCSNIACTSATISNHPSTGQHTSITIGSDGLGLISSYNTSGGGGLSVTHCTNVICDATTNILISADGEVAYDSITIGRDGLGLISYYDVDTQYLKIAHCKNTSCSEAASIVFDSLGFAGHSSATIGPDGMPLISYIINNGDATYSLKVAHCSNYSCVPYFHRR